MELDKINQVDRITLCGYLLNYYSSLQLKALRVCWKLQSKIIKENACIYQYQTNLQYFTALWSSMRWISQILYTKYSRFFKNIQYFLVFRLVRINRLSEIEKKSTRTFIEWIMITKIYMICNHDLIMIWAKLVKNLFVSPFELIHRW